MIPLPAVLAARVETAAQIASPHRRRSVACELGRCVEDLAAIEDTPAARTMAETLAEIRALLDRAGEQGGQA